MNNLIVTGEFKRELFEGEDFRALDFYTEIVVAKKHYEKLEMEILVLQLKLKTAVDQFMIGTGPPEVEKDWNTFCHSCKKTVSYGDRPFFPSEGHPLIRRWCVDGGHWL